MSYDIQFVASIASSPAVRLDLGADPWAVQSSTEFGMPELRRATVSTILADGERYPAAAYGNRVITLVMQVHAAGDDAVASALQQLTRELDRAANILRYRPGTSTPVFFRTFRAGPSGIIWDPFLKQVTCQIPAEPFAYGLRETLSTTTVVYDPGDQMWLNSNPFFETNVAGWTAAGGTFARSTAQQHDGVASGLLTPDGVSATARVESSQGPVTAGTAYRASAWVRCAATRTVDINVNWYGTAGYLSTSTSSVGVTAATWTLLDFAPTAPASATAATVQVSMTGTPSAATTVYIDEARIRPNGPGATGACIDVSAVKGDVETPLFLGIAQGSLTSGPDPRRSVLAVRRRGTPSAAPFVLQAETMTSTLGADTALGTAGDSAMSGTGQNYLRITFATNTNPIVRATLTGWPTAASVDVRGTYRVFARIRKSSANDTVTLNLRMLTSLGTINSDNVTVSTGVANTPFYADLGLVQLPLGPDPVTDGYSGVELPVRGQGVSLGVGRVGTGTVDVDLLLWVPADDRLCLIDWPVDDQLTAIVLDSARTMVYATGTTGEVRATGRVPIIGAPPMVSPGTANRVTFLPDLGTRVNSNLITLTNTVTVTPYYWPRYLYTRPVST